MFTIRNSTTKDFNFYFKIYVMDKEIIPPFPVLSPDEKGGGGPKASGDLEQVP